MWSVITGNFKDMGSLSCKSRIENKRGERQEGKEVEQPWYFLILITGSFKDMGSLSRLLIKKCGF